MIKIDLKIPDFIFGIESSLIKIFIFPILLIIAFFMSLNLVIMPKIEEVKEVDKKTQKIKTEIGTVTEKKKYLLSIDKEELKKNASNMESALLKDKQSYYLVGVVSSIASKYGFQVKSFSISPGELKSEDVVKIADKDVLNKAPVDLSLLGPKEKHIELLLALEKNLPIITINNMDIKSSGNVSELKINISSYYMTNLSSSNISSLTLNDLSLKKDELDLLNRLSEFEKSKIETEPKNENSEKEFTKYERSNPFTL
jgi:Tfp pilus assembly protein PilO